MEVIKDNYIVISCKDKKEQNDITRFICEKNANVKMEITYIGNEKNGIHSVIYLYQGNYNLSEFQKFRSLIYNKNKGGENNMHETTN